MPLDDKILRNNKKRTLLFTYYKLISELYYIFVIHSFNHNLLKEYFFISLVIESTKKLVTIRLRLNCY